MSFADNMERIMKEAAMLHSVQHDSNVKTCIIAALLKELERRTGAPFDLVLDAEELGKLHQDVLNGTILVQFVYDEANHQVTIKRSE